MIVAVTVLIMAGESSRLDVAMCGVRRPPRGAWTLLVVVWFVQLASGGALVDAVQPRDMPGLGLHRSSSPPGWSVDQLET